MTIEIPREIPILIVEDNKMVASMLQDVLERCGQTKVDLAECGERAIEMVRHKYYKLVLMDIGLSDLDGLSITTLYDHPNNHII